MKLLVIAHFKDLVFTLPPEKRAEVAIATMAWRDKYLKSGECKDVYTLGNMRGYVMIWDFASEEEMARISRESPMFDFVDDEYIPLIDVKTDTKLRNRMIKDIQKSTNK